MSVSSVAMNATSAYTAAAKQATQLMASQKVAQPLQAMLPEEQINFSAIATQYMQRFKEKINHTEHLSAKATLSPGSVSAQELVTAISDAEIFVQQTKMIHEKLLLSLQDLFKTPI
jgi:flagellar hook-basal body complex protein FliE